MDRLALRLASVHFRSSPVSSCLVTLVNFTSKFQAITSSYLVPHSYFHFPFPSLDPLLLAATTSKSPHYHALKRLKALVTHTAENILGVANSPRAPICPT